MGKSKKWFDNIGATIFAVLVFCILVTEIITWDSRRFQEEHYHYWIVGFLGWFYLLFNNQKIVDRNEFTYNYVLSFVYIAFGVFKKVITGDTSSDLIVTALPLIYLSLLNIMLIALYPDYPKLKRKPVIISISNNPHWRGKDGGYKPDMKERTLSVVPYIGTIILFFLVAFLFRKTVNL